MGQSVSAHILFGILVGCESCEEEILDFDPDDFEDYIIDNFTDLKKPTELYETNKEKYSEFWAAKREFLKTVELEIAFTGYADGMSDYWLILKGSEIKADNYGFEELDIDEVNKLLNNKELFLDQCKKYNIDLKGCEPKLFLAARLF